MPHLIAAYGTCAGDRLHTVYVLMASASYCKYNPPFVVFFYFQAHKIASPGLQFVYDIRFNYRADVFFAKKKKKSGAHPLPCTTFHIPQGPPVRSVVTNAFSKRLHKFPFTLLVCSFFSFLENAILVLAGIYLLVSITGFSLFYIIIIISYPCSRTRRTPSPAH